MEETGVRDQEGRRQGTGAALRRLAPDLWVAEGRLSLPVGSFPTRMTVIRCGDELLLHSPIALNAALQGEISALGQVRWQVGPSKSHHLYLADYRRAFPAAALYGAPGLPAKRRDLAFDAELGEQPPPGWPAAVRFLLFRGAPLLNEVVFFHRPSRTLILTDLAFNVGTDDPNHARLFYLISGARGRFGPHRLIRLAIWRRGEARRCVEKILYWDFDRIIVAHGHVVESGGCERFREAFRFLLR